MCKQKPDIYVYGFIPSSLERLGIILEIQIIFGTAYNCQNPTIVCAQLRLETIVKVMIEHHFTWIKIKYGKTDWAARNRVKGQYHQKFAGAKTFDIKLVPFYNFSPSKWCNEKNVKSVYGPLSRPIRWSFTVKIKQLYQITETKFMNVLVRIEHKINWKITSHLSSKLKNTSFLETL